MTKTWTILGHFSGHGFSATSRSSQQLIISDASGRRTITSLFVDRVATDRGRFTFDGVACILGRDIPVSGQITEHGRGSMREHAPRPTPEGVMEATTTKRQWLIVNGPETFDAGSIYTSEEFTLTPVGGQEKVEQRMFIDSAHPVGDGHPDWHFRAMFAEGATDQVTVTGIYRPDSKHGELAEE